MTTPRLVSTSTASTLPEALQRMAVDPVALCTCPPDLVRPVAMHLAAGLGALAAGMAEAAACQPEAVEAEPDKLLDVGEAAERLHVSRNYIYKIHRTLPFAIKIGKNQLRFSAAGLERWIKERQKANGK